MIARATMSAILAASLSAAAPFTATHLMGSGAIAGCLAQESGAAGFIDDISAGQRQPATSDPEVDETLRSLDERLADSEKTRRRAAELESRAIEAFKIKDFAQAEKFLREQLALLPDNFIALYNLACARAGQNDARGAMELLARSVEHGFDDIHQLRRDPSLDPVRQLPEFKRLEDAWPDVLIARRDANIRAARAIFDKGYELAFDERLRLAFLYAGDPRTFAAARREIDALADWADAGIFRGILDEQPRRDDPWVVVVLPSRADFTKWLAMRFGSSAITGISSVGGEYDHDLKRLIAQDLGSGLRHEFFHVLHWRSMSRLGQRHPLWIQEGICSLVEDYDTDANGAVRPATSWRTNICKRLERAGRLRGIEDLAKIEPMRFMNSRVLASYARARAAFLYLDDRGMLAEWYRVYTQTYRQDPSGLTAFERVLGRPMREIDKDFRAWIRDLPMVPEEIAPGMASLGVQVDAGEGEGPVVMKVHPKRRGLPTPPLRPGTPRENPIAPPKDDPSAKDPTKPAPPILLQPDDVILAIDGRSTRDIAELVRVLSSRLPGDEVSISVRRAGRIIELPLTLVAKD